VVERYTAWALTRGNLATPAFWLHRKAPELPNLFLPQGRFQPSQPIDGLDLITAVQLCLGRETESCYRLLLWARMRARGESIRAFCVEGGRKRSTFYAAEVASLIGSRPF
jgi:hypothetical protein